MRRMVITICPSYKGDGLKYNRKKISIESLPEYIEKLLERWQWHYDRMIDDEDTEINAEKVFQFGERIAKELDEYLPEYKIKALDEKEVIEQFCQDLDKEASNCRRSQLFNDVIKFCKKKLSLDSSNIKFRKDLSFANFNAEHFDSALEDIQALPEEVREEEIIKFLEGICNFNMQNYAIAESIYDSLLKKSPEDKSFLLAAAENYICIYEYEKACELLERASKVEPDDDDIKFRLASTYHLDEQYSDEKRVLEDLVKIYPNEIYLLSQLSRCYYSCKEYYSSITVLKKILAILPEEGECYYNLALNYYRLKMDNLAVDNYMKAIMKDPCFTRPFWDNDNLLLKLNVDQKLLNEIISFGAEYGDENARKYLETNAKGT